MPIDKDKQLAERRRRHPVPVGARAKLNRAIETTYRSLGQIVLTTIVMATIFDTTINRPLVGILFALMVVLPPTIAACSAAWEDIPDDG
jgi:hypothetical protein